MLRDTTGSEPSGTNLYFWVVGREVEKKELHPLYGVVNYASVAEYGVHSCGKFRDATI